MQRNRLFCLVLLILASCHHPSQDLNSGSTTTQAEGDPEGPPMMEKGTAHVPIHLTPTETVGLSKAVDGTPAPKDSTIPHIHADVQDGHLVFVPEQPQDPSHVTPDATRITVPGHNPKIVQVVATPAAKQLLDERTVQTH